MLRHRSPAARAATRDGAALTIRRMAEPAPTTAREEAPPLDPGAVERAYRLHRARRAARARWHRERKWAGIRFWLVLALVVAVAVLLATRTLGEIERVFGL